MDPDPDPDRPNLTGRYTDLGINGEPLPNGSDDAAAVVSGTPHRLFQRPAPRLGVVAWLGSFLADVYDGQWTPPTADGVEFFDRDTWIAALANVIHVVSHPDCDDALNAISESYPWSALAWTSKESTLTFAILAGALQAIGGNTFHLALIAVEAFGYWEHRVAASPGSVTDLGPAQNESLRFFEGADWEAFIDRIVVQAMSFEVGYQLGDSE